MSFYLPKEPSKIYCFIVPLIGRYIDMITA